MKFKFRSVDDLPQPEALREMIKKHETMQEIESRVMESVNWAANNYQTGIVTQLDPDEFDYHLVALVAEALRRKGYRAWSNKDSYSFNGAAKIEIGVYWNEDWKEDWDEEGETK